MAHPHQNPHLPNQLFALSASPAPDRQSPRDQLPLPPNPFAFSPTPQPASQPAPQPAATPQPATMSAAATFINDHTTVDNNIPFTDECPICLDNYRTEQCLRITGIAGCTHHVGLKCLREMLNSHTNEEKKCPLCRAIWIPRPLPAYQGQSLAMSRRMAGMFAGLDGIGENIANNTPPPPRRDPHPIVLDSDSEEEDYETQVQNFETSTREIAEIRNRARNTQMGRSHRRWRQQCGGAANHVGNESNNSDSGGAHDGGNSSLTRANTAARGATGTGAFNRLMNRGVLNPFRPSTAASNFSPPIENNDDLYRRNISPHALQSSSPPLTSPSPPPVFDMDDQDRIWSPLEGSAPHRGRETEIHRREQALAVRETAVARREAEVRRTLEVLERQRAEVEELLVRHANEVEGVMR
ncbi:hypothetical protein BDW02DRAFT_576987 [Decorospora gaudefroyi]|uniref:RING-type domain-containing protein n=1 Tax=Decorospora gaudefroyi TaxID=184978 RepID=A0A6A5KNI4_9PLEO|nr:hypothetical protein BDW02DRAFT_576987 [Decorospora gaudefroyi]